MLKQRLIIGSPGNNGLKGFSKKIIVKQEFRISVNNAGRNSEWYHLMSKTTFFLASALDMNHKHNTQCRQSRIAIQLIKIKDQVIKWLSIQPGG